MRYHQTRELRGVLLIRKRRFKRVRLRPVSAFGGIIALNRIERHGRLEKLFVEVIVAPEASDEAIELLSVRKNHDYH